MKLRLLASMLVILMLSGCSRMETAAPTQPPSSETITADEYAVLSALIDSLYPKSAATTMIVHDSTSTGIYQDNLDSVMTLLLQHLAQYVPVLKAETMLDFKTKNLTRAYIQDPVSIHPNCILSSTSQTVYPWFEVSRVGFRSDRQQAIAYIGHMIVPRAGLGTYYVLFRDNNKWRITGFMNSWVS